MSDWMAEPCERCGRRDGLHFVNNVAEYNGVVTPLGDFCEDDDDGGVGGAEAEGAMSEAEEVHLTAGVVCYTCGKTVPMESGWRPMDIPPLPGFVRSIVNVCADCAKERGR